MYSARLESVTDCQHSRLASDGRTGTTGTTTSGTRTGTRTESVGLHGLGVVRLYRIGLRVVGLVVD